MYLALSGMYRVQEGFSGLAVRKLKYQALSKPPHPFAGISKEARFKNSDTVLSGASDFLPGATA